MPARKIDTNNIRDVDWVKQSFMMDSSSISTEDLAYRTFTSAAYKFADTSPGGNAAINPPPQFTRYADIKLPGVGPNSLTDNAQHGMGRYYSEAIDDNAVHAVMRFGVPQYNALTTFFTNFYNAEAAAMAHTGRGTSAFFKAGQAIGFIVGIVPRALIFMGNVARWFAGSQPSKYYYMKPAMSPYWNAVATMLNTIAVNMGVLPPPLDINGNHINDPDQNGGPTKSGDSTALNNFMAAMLPDIFTGGAGGGIDVYAIGTKYQRLYQAWSNSGRDDLTNQNSKTSDVTGQEGLNLLRKTLGDFAQKRVTASPIYGSLPKYADAYIGLSTTQYNQGGDYSQSQANNSSFTPPGGTSSSSNAPAPAPEATPPAIDTGSSNSTESIFPPGSNHPFDPSYWDKTWDFYKSEHDDGGAFISFRIDGSGTIGESFSNSTRPSELQQKINSMSSSSASARFSVADGNVGTGAIASTIQGFIGGIKDTLAGFASEVGLAGLAALAGSAFVDIPESWDTSTARLPSADFTIQLRSPYGNKLSRLLNLYLPLCMLLAGALPLSTGKKSYTSPFLCEIYVRGRMTCRLGIIDSLNITRGAGNVGWTDEGEPLGIDVSFSVKDLSSIMYMPVAANFTAFDAAVQGLAQSAGSAIAGNKGAATGSAIAASLSDNTWDDDNTFTDYMAVLGSLTMTDQVSKYRQWKLRVAQQAVKFNAWKSPGHFAAWINSTLPGRIISGFAPAARLGQTGA